MIEQLDLFNSAPTTVASGKVKPKNKYDVPKIVATLTKAMLSTQKKADAISTEVSGNYTHKRGQEAGHRRKNKQRLEIYVQTFKNIISKWDDDTLPEELRGIRALSHIEFIAYNSYPNPPDNKTSEWRKEEYPTIIKKFNKLGIYSNEEAKAISLILDSYGQIIISPEEQKKIDLRNAIENLQGSRIPGFFPTPEILIDKMLDEASVYEKRAMNFLEPSAGIGHIADKIISLNYDHKVDLVERHFSLCEILTLKGYDTIDQIDILEYNCGDFKYDRIIMNPPFENKQDIDHVTHCFNNYLVRSGILVSIMSNGIKSNADKKSVAFRELVDEYGYFVELEGGEFKGAFNSTGVSTIIVVLKK